MLSWPENSGLGPDAVGGNHQVIATRFPVGERDRDTVRTVLECLVGDAFADPHAEALGGGLSDFEKHRPVDTYGLDSAGP
jgi:hypothetical protein